MFCHCFCTVKHSCADMHCPNSKTYFIHVYASVLCIMMTSSNGNIFSVTGPLWGESPGDRWIPLTKASGADFWYFDLCLNKRLSKQFTCRWFERPSCSLWRHCNDDMPPIATFSNLWPYFWNPPANNLLWDDSVSPNIYSFVPNKFPSYFKWLFDQMKIINMNVCFEFAWIARGTEKIFSLPYQDCRLAFRKYGTDESLSNTFTKFRPLSAAVTGFRPIWYHCITGMS